MKRRGGDNNTTSSNVVGSKKSSTFLQSARAVIVDQSTKRRKNVRILFDNCSQKSFLTEDAAKALNLHSVRKERIIVNGFGGKDEKLVCLDIVRVSVHNTQGVNCGEVDLYVVPFICKPICDQKIELAQATYEHLISLNLADSSDGKTTLEIDVLIGADFYWQFVTDDMVRGDNGPVAVNTSLGWVLSGNMGGREEITTNLVSAHVMYADTEDASDELNDLVQKFWKLDAIGISDEKDVNVLDHFKKNIAFFENGRYSVCLPWKEAIDMIPDNYLLCKARLLSQMKRLRNDPKLLEEYYNRRRYHRGRR